VADPPEQAAAVAALLASNGIEETPVSAGDQRQIDAVRWTVLWPRRVIRSGSIPNNASVVLAVEVGGRSLLLTGDVEHPAQSAILPDLVGMHFDVVKVPHHGSADQDPRLAPLTSPAAALISVGAGNTYGHPADETVDEWRVAGTLVARTDLDGDIAVVRTESGIGIVARH
jgi:competence protein ComEC